MRHLLPAAFGLALAIGPLPARAADPLSFDIGRDRVLISCASYLSARLEEDASVEGDNAERMKNTALALLAKALDARAPEGDALRETHRKILQERLYLLSTAWRVQMRKNFEAQGTITGDSQAVLDEQIVCNDLFRILRGD